MIGGEGKMAQMSDSDDQSLPEVGLVVLVGWVMVLGVDVLFPPFAPSFCVLNNWKQDF